MKPRPRLKNYFPSMVLAILIFKMSSPMSFWGLFLVLLAQADFELAHPHLSLLYAGMTGVSYHT